MSWRCNNCREIHSDQFDCCWWCGRDRNGQVVVDFQNNFDGLTDTEIEDLRNSQFIRDPDDSINDEWSLSTTTWNEPAQTQPQKIERPPPRPFLHRLNQYFQRELDTAIPSNSYQSRMRFWMAPIRLVFTPTKSVEYIRMILRRIRRRVRNPRK